MKCKGEVKYFTEHDANGTFFLSGINVQFPKLLSEVGLLDIL